MEAETRIQRTLFVAGQPSPSSQSHQERQQGVRTWQSGPCEAAAMGAGQALQGVVSTSSQQCWSWGRRNGKRYQDQGTINLEDPHCRTDLTVFNSDFWDSRCEWDA